MVPSSLPPLAPFHGTSFSRPIKLLDTLTLLLLTLALLSQALLSRSINDNNLGLYQRPCDTDQCDSLVSKCKLTDRCLCDFKKDASCARDCIECLEEKFGKCCACVGMCPVPANDTHSSHVGDTSASDQQLFETLTESQDIHNRWTSVRVPMSIDFDHPEVGKLQFAYRSDNLQSLISHDEELDVLDCTVAYINKQLSMSKCKRFCTSMGAVHFRWFHEGCCECIGTYCLRYGIDEPRCEID